ncbi:hypothetical protein LTS08_002371 [Lithohypha guttulata]|nr:hypothetical protein LTS08_002371 [Lithohypha guttulata]
MPTKRGFTASQNSSKRLRTSAAPAGSIESFLIPRTATASSTTSPTTAAASADEQDRNPHDDEDDDEDPETFDNPADDTIPTTEALTYDQAIVWLNQIHTRSQQTASHTPLTPEGQVMSDQIGGMVRWIIANRWNKKYKFQSATRYAKGNSKKIKARLAAGGAEAYGNIHVRYATWFSAIESEQVGVDKLVNIVTSSYRSEVLNALGAIAFDEAGTQVQQLVFLFVAGFYAGETSNFPIRGSAYSPIGVELIDPPYDPINSHYSWFVDAATYSKAVIVVLASLDHLKISKHSDPDGVDFLLHLIETVDTSMFETLQPPPVVSTDASKLSNRIHGYEFVRDLGRYARENLGVPELMPHEQWNHQSPLTQNHLTMTLRRAEKAQWLSAWDDVIANTLKKFPLVRVQGIAKLVAAELATKYPDYANMPGFQMIEKRILEKNLSSLITVHNWQSQMVMFENIRQSAKDAIMKMAEEELEKAVSEIPAVEDVAAQLLQRCHALGMNVSTGNITRSLDRAAIKLAKPFRAAWTQNTVKQHTWSKAELVLILETLHTYEKSELPFYYTSGVGVENVTAQIWSAIRTSVNVTLQQLVGKLEKFYTKSLSANSRKGTSNIMPELIERLEKHVETVGDNNCGDLDITFHPNTRIAFTPPEDDLIFSIAIKYVSDNLPGGYKRQEAAYGLLPIVANAVVKHTPRSSVDQILCMYALPKAVSAFNREAKAAQSTGDHDAWKATSIRRGEELLRQFIGEYEVANPPAPPNRPKTRKTATRVRKSRAQKDKKKQQDEDDSSSGNEDEDVDSPASSKKTDKKSRKKSQKKTATGGKGGTKKGKKEQKDKGNGNSGSEYDDSAWEE